MVRSHHHSRCLSLRRSLLLCGSFVLAASTAALAGDNWPAWRGPKLDGISDVSNLPVRFSKTENVIWRTPLSGPAGATPVIWGNQIFLTSAEDERLLLECLSTSGELLWQRQVDEGNKVVRGDEGNSASPSPLTDGQHVWSFMGTGMLACFDFSGNPVWKLDVEQRYGELKIAFGMTSTPVLDGDRLYLQLIHSGGAIVVALDKNTGEEIWKTNRPSDARMECEHSYASPILYRDAEREFLLTHGADYIIAHRLEDGAEIWRCGGLNPKGKYNPTLRFVASPTWAEGIIIVPSAKNGPVLALRPNRSGDLADSADGHLWIRDRNTPDVPSPLIVDGLVYLCRENGDLICLDADSGEEIYYERTHRQRHRASPLYADGKIYLAARDGVVTVVRAGRSSPGPQIGG